MTDDQLWLEMKSGDKAALSTMYNQEINFLIGYGCKINSDESLVEDCIQELFVEIWKNRSGLSDTDNIRRYLLVALRRKIIRKSKSNVVAIEESNSFMDETDDADYRLLKDETENTQKEILQEALKRLPPRQKEAIHLKYYEELSYDELCNIMGINYQAARNMISKGIKQLSKVISKREIDDS